MIRRWYSISRPLKYFVGLEGLRNAEDFQSVAQEAIKKTEPWIRDIDSVSAGPKVIETMDVISDAVCRVADVANFCFCVHPDENWRLQAFHAFQHLVKYIGTLNSNAALFERLKASLELRKQSLDSWTVETSIVGESLFRDFANCGMGSTQNEEIQNLIETENALSMEFQRRAVEQRELNALTLTDISMLPVDLQQACIQHSGHYHLPMTPLNYHTIQILVKKESLRKDAYEAHFQSLQDNVVTLQRLLETRKQWAETLGWESFAHFKLQDSIVSDPTAAQQFIKRTANRIRSEADEDIKTLEKIKGSVIFPWDVQHLINEARSRRIQSLGSRMVYGFELQSVINGLAQILRNCLNIQMAELKRTELWDSSVQVFAFHDTSTDALIGHLYMDLMSRRNKRPENAHYTLRCGRIREDGQYQTPIVALVTNFESRHLGYSELKALLHEFGHVLHSLLCKTRYQHLFGTRGPLDLVEVPSHFFEQLLTQPEILQYFSGLDAQTRQLPSVDALKNFLQVNEMFSNLRLQEHLRIALADQLFHGTTMGENTKSTSDVMQCVHDVVGSLPYVPGTFKEAWLTHLTTYGARYYAYIYSKSIANIAWETRFTSDFINPSTWQEIRQHLFQPGGAIDPQEYVWNLIGKNRLTKWKNGWFPK